MASFKEDKSSQIFHSQCPNCKHLMFAKPSDGANNRQIRFKARRGEKKLLQPSFYNVFNGKIWHFVYFFQLII